jgi:hypothetical protein
VLPDEQHDEQHDEHLDEHLDDQLYNDYGWNDLHYNDCALYSGWGPLQNRRNPSTVLQP